MPDFRRLAIVNRGEPAMRALHAVAELNRDGTGPPVTTIALFTDPDARAWFVREADEAVPLGPSMYVDPVSGIRRSAYLDEERVVGLLRAAGADAAWVGWGFVAESATFAERCEQAGITFIGPRAATIRHLGDKVAAKRLAESLEVPVVPWSGGAVQDVGDAVVHAERLGYPVMLKALAGGGGRGMRLARDADELAAALPSARAEAELAFGDPGIFLERVVEHARHVEVQIVADTHGTTWAVGVRDCSLQRRHQKVVEESACTVLDAAGEAALLQAAVRLTSAAEYVGAGTVEFLVAPDGTALFMEVNTRLQVEHPVTEETTGLDLVKLQLHIARGGRLEGEPPTPRGHAVEVRLNAEDPEQGFAPAPGRIVLLRPPSGPGLRVDIGVTQGETISGDFDAMIAKVVAWGRDRTEALARLRRGLAQSSVVIDSGTTNRSFLLTLLAHPDVVAGRHDIGWLDRMTAAESLLPEPDPIAVLAAAVAAYDADDASDRAAFQAFASRGRPEMPDEAGHRVKLRYRGVQYELGVFRTGPGAYRVRTDAGNVDLHSEQLGDVERRLSFPGRRHRVMTVHQGSSMLVSISGTTHRVHRDDGGAVRAGWPAFVVAVRVAPGDEVAEGDPLVTLESMKMETTVNAPYAGRVLTVDVGAKAQVEIGAPLVHLQSGADSGKPLAVSGTAVDFAPLVSAADDAGHACVPVYSALRSYLLGYDLDAGSLQELLAAHRRVANACAADDATLLVEEERLLDLFADVAVLYRPQPDPGRSDLTERSEQEYLLAFLQWLDPDRAGLPTSFRQKLERALARYGVPGLERTPALEEAVVWMFRSFSRVGELVPVVLAVLERRLHARDALQPTAGPELRALLDRLVEAAQSRHHLVADLARDVRFRFFDEPLLDRVAADVHAEMEGHLDALAADATRPDREARIERLVWSPQPMRGVLLRRWRDATPDVRRVLLEVYARRFYRIRPLEQPSFHEHQGVLLCSVEYTREEARAHVVCGYVPLDDLADLAAAVAEHLRDVPAERQVVVDVVTWRPGPRHDADSTAEELLRLLAGCDFGRQLHRLDVTVTSETGPLPEAARTQHFTFRQRPEGWVEERLYRNLHPMIAKRMNLWRLSNFAVRRLPSAEDVYLFHAVAHENPKDERLIAIAEVRDLTPVLDGAGRITSLPLLERIGLLSLAAMRDALAEFPERRRPQMNRIVIYVRPPWTLPREQWRDFARMFAPLSVGVGLEKVLLRVDLPDGDGLRHTVLQIEGIGERGLTVRELPPSPNPIHPLTQYQQMVLRARRAGAPYPYEIVTMLTPPQGIPADFPPGWFVEHDLDADGRLVPVDRAYGENVANLVVGLITNVTETVPEGMTRVALLGDPTRSLGALAEPECRRIIAALDLAERLHLPVEWFALSSGARIAMDSGTENMDWIAAVLRRIIEFTQRGGELNVVVTGINVGAQPYWNAEATMLMHTSGILVMTPDSAMVLTGKQALDFSGGVSAEDNFGIGGFERVMGPNGQGQYWAPDLAGACEILLRHYDHSYIVPGERFPRRAETSDPVDRDVRSSPHTPVDGSDFTTVGDVFSEERNPDRKKPFDIRSVMRAVIDADSAPLERWASWRDAESAVVWDAKVGGIPVSLLGLESRTIARRGFVPADGPPTFTSGTLFPQSSRKVARAINAASGNRPLVVLANLSGFDGSPESMRKSQLEYGAEIGRAITNFRGPVVFVVVSRYHGGAFVVFSKALNPRLEIAAVEGSFASVIGGAPAAAVVFARDVASRTERDPRVAELRELLATAERHGDDAGRDGLRARLHETITSVHSERLGDVAAEFDRIHSIERALSVGSVDRIISAAELRPYVVDALVRGLQHEPVRLP